MSRSMLLFARCAAVFAALALGVFYVSCILPIDRNIVSMKACAGAFLGGYLAMTAALLVLPSTRKLDLGILCGVLLSLALMAQLGLFALHRAPMPHLSEAMSGGMGILASVLPVYIASVRRQAREKRSVSQWVAARKMVSPAGSGQVILPH